jgi:hypothetical protein
MKSVYIETSIVSYLTARPSRDLRAAAWQQITTQWWEQERLRYDVLTSEVVLTEASLGDAHAAQKRLVILSSMKLLDIDDESKSLARRFISEGALPGNADVDALHIAIACVNEIDYLLTWNCRHIDNAATKPIIRSICVVSGYSSPEICTPLELLS